MSFDFRNLKVYKKAKAFHLSSLKLLEELKHSPKKYFVSARASIVEYEPVSLIIHDGTIIDKVTFELLLRHTDELSRMLV